jgi:hypothetical protein
MHEIDTRLIDYDATNEEGLSQCFLIIEPPKHGTTTDSDNHVFVYKINIDSLLKFINIESNTYVLTCKENEQNGPTIGKLAHMSIKTVLGFIPCYISLVDILKIFKYSIDHQYTFMLLNNPTIMGYIDNNKINSTDNTKNTCIETNVKHKYDVHNVSEQMITRIKNAKREADTSYGISPSVKSISLSSLESNSTPKSKSRKSKAKKGTKKSPSKQKSPDTPTITVQTIQLDRTRIGTNVEIRTNSWNGLKEELVKIVKTDQNQQLDLENTKYIIDGTPYTGNPTIDFPEKDKFIMLVQFKPKS